MRKLTGRSAALVLLAVLALASCSPEPNPPAPIVCERLVVATFSPDGSFTADTYIDLFDSSGDPDADDPWAGDDTAEAIAWDDDSGYTPSMSKIDYTGGLTAGTYYIRVRGKTAAYGIDEWYGFRVRSLNVGDPLPAYPDFGTPATWLPLSAKPDADEVDDNPTSGGVPANPVAIDLGEVNAVSRSLYVDGTDPDIDWFVIVLN